MLSDFEIGSIVSGKVIKIKPFGAIISLNNNTQGLVHISHVSNNFVQNINEYLAIGDVVTVKVISIDDKINKIALSIKEVEPKGKNSSYAKNSYADKKINRSKSSGFDARNDNFSKNYDSDYHSKNRDSTSSFDDKLKEWLKQSNERQSGLNKRKNRR